MINFAEYCSLMKQGDFEEAGRELQGLRLNIEENHPDVAIFLRDQKSLAQLASEVYVAYSNNNLSSYNGRSPDWVGFEFGKPQFPDILTFGARYQG